MNDKRELQAEEAIRMMAAAIDDAGRANRPVEPGTRWWETFLDRSIACESRATQLIHALKDPIHDVNPYAPSADR